MINAKELRIGNLVYEDETIHEWNIYDYTLNQEFYSPIPLTPEILIDCGFENLYKNQWVKGDSVEIRHYEIGNWYELLDGDEYATFPAQIRSLHQLQNLYFSLTGEELTYTPLTQTIPSGSNTVQNTEETNK